MYGTKDHAAKLCQAQAPNPQNISPITHSTGVTPVKAKPNPTITRNQAFSLFKINDVENPAQRGVTRKLCQNFKFIRKYSDKNSSK